MASTQQVFLAVDIGASSGRLVAGSFDGMRLQLEEVGRFPNGGVTLAGRLHWDVLRQWSCLLDVLTQAAARFGDSAISVGVDTWGVDFGLLGRGDELLGNPLHYRDQATQGVMELAFARVPRPDIYAATGLQFMPFNTLYQLLALQQRRSVTLEAAERLLMIPDLFHWMLTGLKVNEYTNASTTQLLDPRTRTWSPSLMQAFELPGHLFGEPVEPGFQLGPLRPEVSQATGWRQLQVVAPGTHDTASAVMAVPAATAPSVRPDWCYISSGTWSLMGVESSEPIISADSERLNFTNEGGVGRSVRVLKNIAGLWLLQECRRIWNRDGADVSWEQLIDEAQAAQPLQSCIHPDHPRFVAPADMPAEIQAFCRETGQPTPSSRGAIVRTALESLALRYRMVLQWLEQLTGGAIATIHIVGGGSQNSLLNQMAADACRRVVLAGPSEATALGNILVQLVAAGRVQDALQARQLVRASFGVTAFEPRDTAAWDEAFARFVAITQQTEA